MLLMEIISFMMGSLDRTVQMYEEKTPALLNQIPDSCNRFTDWSEFLGKNLYFDLKCRYLFDMLCPWMSLLLIAGLLMQLPDHHFFGLGKSPISLPRHPPSTL
jgi:hypothetical protein